MIHHIQNKVPTCAPNDTLLQVQESLRREVSRLETINYIYVLDEQQHLLGVFSIKELYRQPGTTRVDQIYTQTPLITVHPESHNEEAAYLALEHNIKDVPVVDSDNCFLGVIPNEKILDILHNELRQDQLQAAGVHRSHVAFDNVMTTPVWKSLEHRLPWLVVGLVGGLAIARIVGSFEQTLAKNLILAAFIPLIIYIADAVQTQLEAFTIRDLALFRRLNFAKYFIRQIGIILIMALTMSAIVIMASGLIYGEWRIALILGLALFCATLATLFSGIIIPYIFRRLKQDPANASGPIGTIIQDMLSVTIYFLIASWLL